MVKSPCADVTVVRSCPVSASLAVTRAPGTTPPLESVTVPVMVPRSVCAEEGIGSTVRTNSDARAADFQDFMTHPTCSQSRSREEILHIGLLGADVDAALRIPMWCRTTSMQSRGEHYSPQY